MTTHDISVTAKASATFTYRFFGWLDALAQRWVNPDGSEGGIVAVDATIDAKITLSVDVVVGPRASIGYGASIGEGDWHMTVGPIGSRNAMSTAVYSKEHGLRWWVGCQRGISTDVLLARVQTEHGDSAHGDDYHAAIKYVTGHPGLARAMAHHGITAPAGGEKQA